MDYLVILRNPNLQGYSDLLININKWPINFTFKDLCNILKDLAFHPFLNANITIFLLNISIFICDILMQISNTHNSIKSTLAYFIILFMFLLDLGDNKTNLDLLQKRTSYHP